MSDSPGEAFSMYMRLITTPGYGALNAIRSDGVAAATRGATFKTTQSIWNKWPKGRKRNGKSRSSLAMQVASDVSAVRAALRGSV